MHITAYILALGAACAPPGTAPATQRASRMPPAFRAMLNAREHLGSGRIEWEAQTHVLGHDRTLHFVSRYARNGDWIFENRGDDQGWTEWDVGGRPRSRFPRLALRNKEGFWHYRETNTVLDHVRDAAAAPRRYGAKDIRTLGLWVASSTLDEGAEAALLGLGDPVDGRTLNGGRRWPQQRDGDRFVVRREHPGGVVVEWVIDASRGWNAERVTYRKPDGGIEAVAVSALANYDGVWFPRKTEYFLGGQHVDTALVTRAEFKGAAGAPAFTLSDMGVQVGINIQPIDYHVPDGVLIWDGQGPVEAEEYARRLRAGLIQPGPIMTQKAQGAYVSPYRTPEQRPAMTGMAGIESEWRRYVREFAAAHALDDAQQKAAYAILADCEARARRILAADAEPPRAVQTRPARDDTDAVRRPGDGPPEPALRARLRQVFEGELVPRLQGLLRRDQRGATSAPSSRRTGE